MRNFFGLFSLNLVGMLAFSIFSFAEQPVMSGSHELKVSRPTANPVLEGTVIIKSVDLKEDSPFLRVKTTDGSSKHDPDSRYAMPLLRLEDLRFVLDPEELLEVVVYLRQKPYFKKVNPRGGCHKRSEVALHDLAFEKRIGSRRVYIGYCDMTPLADWNKDQKIKWPGHSAVLLEVKTENGVADWVLDLLFDSPMPIEEWIKRLRPARPVKFAAPQEQKESKNDVCLYYYGDIFGGFSGSKFGDVPKKLPEDWTYNSPDIIELKRKLLNDVKEDFPLHY